MTELSKRLDALSPEKRKLLEIHLKNKEIELDKINQPLFSHGVGESIVDQNPEKIDKRLRAEYYYREDGEIDEFVSILECFPALLYFILKNKLGASNPCELFLQDIGFRMIQNRDGMILNLEYLDQSFYQDVFRLKFYDQKGGKAFSGIETLLERGDLVIVETFSERLPFFKWYIGLDTPKDAHHFEHAFLVIWYHQEQYFYVEAPWNLHPDNFIPYSRNKSIGIIQKSDLIPAFETHLRYGTVNILKNKLPDSRKALRLIKKLIDRSTTSYHKNTKNQGGLKISYGKVALDQLIEICGRQCIYLNQEINPNQTLYVIFALKLWGIINRRKVLYHSLHKFEAHWNQFDIQKVLRILDETIQTWIQTFYFLEGKYKRANYLLDVEVQKYFIKIAELEEKLILLLQYL